MGYSDIDTNSQWVVDWVHRMAGKHGGIVHDIDGPSLDWGQALCRGRYGLGWNAILSSEQIESPDLDAIVLAAGWERGSLPDWMDIDRMGRDRTRDVKAKAMGAIDNLVDALR